ncbi:MAG: hypothetical protein ACJ76D_08550 [Solirubrobacterales bacterium]
MPASGPGRTRAPSASPEEDLGWWIAVVNQTGSALFMAAAIAAFVRPSSGDELAVGVANWATFAGAACFAAAGAMQELERP